jgi:hypothetical protein
MEPILVFHGRWSIVVTELTLGAGGPAVRLTLTGAGGADGAYLNPPVGTRWEAEGESWVLAVEVSLDLQPFRHLEPRRTSRSIPRAAWSRPGPRAPRSTPASNSAAAPTTRSCAPIRGPPMTSPSRRGGVPARALRAASAWPRRRR